MQHCNYFGFDSYILDAIITDPCYHSMISKVFSFYLFLKICNLCPPRALFSFILHTTWLIFLLLFLFSFNYHRIRQLHIALEYVKCLACISFENNPFLFYNNRFRFLVFLYFHYRLRSDNKLHSLKKYSVSLLSVWNISNSFFYLTVVFNIFFSWIFAQNGTKMCRRSNLR